MRIFLFNRGVGQLLINAHIKDYDGKNLVVVPEISVERELLQKQVGKVEIRLNDGRIISAEQRKAIFAIIADIGNWSGHEREDLKDILKWEYSGKYNGGAGFSLSDVDMTTARGFLDFLIAFCFNYNVPTKNSLKEHSDEISRYLYRCLEYRKCAICNKRAEVHHVERVGMGRDREKIVHIGMEAVALCTVHHDQAHRDEKALFEAEHIYGIKLDKYLCKKLRLGVIK